MPGFSSLNIAITGLRAAQQGLAVTGHNMANAEISGYTRQRSIQIDHRSRQLGFNAAGNMLLVGTGVDNQAVHNIRSKYFDIIYRQHNARLHFHSVIAAAGDHIEMILGETDTTYKLSDLLNDMWNSIQELSMDLSAIETREFFISTSIAFLDKANSIFESLFAFQQNLDGQIRVMVADINEIVAGIEHLNREIRAHELTGDNANDLRDERNRLMDRLSGLIPTDFFENTNGDIDILTMNGNFLLHQGTVNPLGLLQISGRYNFVEPVFTHSREVLEWDTPPRMYRPLFNWNAPLNVANGNDEGALLALMRARGAMPATYRGIEALWEPVRTDQRPAAFVPGPSFWPEITLDPSDPGFPAAWDAYITEWLPYLPVGWDLPLDDPAHPRNNGYRGPIPPSIGFPAGTNNNFPPILYDDPTTWPAEWNDIWPVSDWPVGSGNHWPAGGAGVIVNFYDNPMFLNQFRRYQMERENDMNQFQMLYPLSVTDPATFNANRNPPSQEFLDVYHAVRRTYRQAAWSKVNGMVPRVMMEMDTVVNSVVRLINNALAPVVDYIRYQSGPFDLNRERSFTEVFIRRPSGTGSFPRFGDDGIHNPGMAGWFDSLYTTRNLILNPLLLQPGGYNLLAFHLDADNQDTRLIQEMISWWGSAESNYAITVGNNTFSLRDAYRMFIIELGMETQEAVTQMGIQFNQVSQADYRRNAISGVSLDEELSSMLTFQFAYQAAARLFNIVDSMIDTVINRM